MPDAPPNPDPYPLRSRFDLRDETRRWQAWLDSPAGQESAYGTATGQELRNRLLLAFQAGMEAVLAMEDGQRAAGAVWVSVADRLPDRDGMVLACAPSADPDKPLIATAWYDPAGFGWSLISADWAAAITHWMPLPSRPTVSVTREGSK